MPKVRILVLGHKGMLGRTLVRYFNETGAFSVSTLTTRWGEPDFLENIRSLEPDAVINCIGKIPQKHPSSDDYVSINIELPRSLEKLGLPIIHPSTDCEFKGTIPPGVAYAKNAVRDAEDTYGESKALISAEIEADFKYTKIIRTSIIGHEEKTAVALLDWFLSQTGAVRGYTNHYWNGLTTLEWAKQAEKLVRNWDNMPTLNQYGSKTHYSKFDILCLVNDVYQKNTEIIPFETELTVNKCLQSDVIVPELKDQLLELKTLFRK